MKSFLERVAEDVYEKLGGDFTNLTVIFPNKRARLFYDQHIASLSTRQSMWAPKYTSISDLFDECSDLVLADNLMLTCLLYEAYVKVTGSTETLDNFFQWGDMMLSDFEDVDNNLVDAGQLFGNMRDLDEMGNDSYLTDRQKDAIRRYFDKVRGDERSLERNFKTLWMAMYDIYEEFRRRLGDEKYAYAGMQKRDVIEKLKAGDAETMSHLKDRCFVIVGFNVLNKTEEQLFQILKKETKTMFYWDYDKAYLDNEGFEAGRFIKENIMRFGNELPEDDPVYNQFSAKKQITFVAASTENAQSRYTTKWLKDNISTDEPFNQSAVVLCNEGLLQPVLNAIPDMQQEIGVNMPLNITMGYPLQKAPVCNFVLSLFALQTHGWGNGTWRHSFVKPVLNHPYMRLLTEERSIAVLDTLRKDNVLYPTEDYFKDDEVLSYVFSPKTDSAGIVDWLMQITEWVGMKFRDGGINENDNENENDDDNDGMTRVIEADRALYAESVYELYVLLRRVAYWQKRLPQLGGVSSDTLMRILRQLINTATIPFHGEPAVGLQIMGMLETRNLDFRNILMLSVSEGQLPNNDHISSLIPYTLRDSNGMTTIEKRVSLQAYYFYRLVGRAENITLMYNDSTDEDSVGSKGEMSRFMTQLLIEKNVLFGAEQKISMQALTASLNPAGYEPQVVEKTDEIMARLKEKDYISPSALITYLKCGLKFYMQYVAKLYTEDEQTEDVDNAAFGTIFHYCMEKLYGRFLGRGEVRGSDIRALLKDKKLIDAVVDEAFAINFFHDKEKRPFYRPVYRGEQKLNRHVLERYVRNQLEYDAELCSEQPMQVLALEKSFYTTFETGRGDTVKIGGIVDRLDMVTIDGRRTLRIVDYKTSSTAHTAKDIEVLFDAKSINSNYHIQQALYYCYVMTESDNNKLNGETLAVAPSLMYVKIAREKRQNLVSIGKSQISDFAADEKQEYAQKLKEKMEEIYNPDIAFKPAENASCCDYCDFAAFCHGK